MSDRAGNRASSTAGPSPRKINDRAADENDDVLSTAYPKATTDRTTAEIAATA